jgi:hypothetical protein
VRAAAGWSDHWISFTSLTPPVKGIGAGP